MRAPTHADIDAAVAMTEGVVRKTPLLESERLNQIAGRRVLVKAECLQITGSFKFRGAWNAISSLTQEERSRGVVAYSSGNHAQGVAEAARRWDCAATIIMPADAPRAKREGTLALGAEVVSYDRLGGESREAIGAALALERGLSLIKPYDDARVIAGQASCGVEIARQAEAAGIERADVLVCCGGGGLCAGVALALAKHAPALRARPVEPDSADDTCRSLASGVRQTIIGTPDPLCDAIITPTPGELTFPIMMAHCGPGLSVSNDDVLTAMRLAAQHVKLVVEPGGAVALAAALRARDLPDGQAVIAIATGGNVDAEIWTQALNQ